LKSGDKFSLLTMSADNFKSTGEGLVTASVSSLVTTSFWWQCLFHG